MGTVEHRVGAFRRIRVVLVPIGHAIFDPVVLFKYLFNCGEFDGRAFLAFVAPERVAAIFKGSKRSIAMLAFPIGSLDGKASDLDVPDPSFTRALYIGRRDGGFMAGRGRICHKEERHALPARPRCAPAAPIGHSGSDCRLCRLPYLQCRPRPNG